MFQVFPGLAIHSGIFQEIFIGNEFSRTSNELELIFVNSYQEFN
jgi:hypothetical protein